MHKLLVLVTNPSHPLGINGRRGLKAWSAGLCTHCGVGKAAKLVIEMNYRCCPKGKTCMLPLSYALRETRLALMKHMSVCVCVCRGEACKYQQELALYLSAAYY